MTEILILLLTFTAVWLAAVGVGFLIGSSRRVDRRLEALAGGLAAAGHPSTRPEPGRAGTLARPFANPAAAARPREPKALEEALRRELWRAGLHVRPPRLLQALALGLVVVGIGGSLAGGLLTGFMAVLGGGAGAGLFLRQRQAQRTARLEAQLPDALSLMAASLRSGYSFIQALQAVSEQMPTPMAEEMRRVVDEAAVGVSLEEALDHLVERVRSYDMDLLVTAVVIQYRVGGNLATLLDTIAETIRERFRTRGEVRALTAEGRLSALVLFLLPIAMFVLLLAMNPSYMRPLFMHPIGQVMLLGVIMLQVTGGVIIRRMLTIDP